MPDGQCLKAVVLSICFSSFVWESKSGLCSVLVGSRILIISGKFLIAKILLAAFGLK